MEDDRCTQTGVARQVRILRCPVAVPMHPPRLLPTQVPMTGDRQPLKEAALLRNGHL